MVKHLSPVRETWVRSLGQDDLLEKEVATHSSNSCLENSMDGGAWCAIVRGVTKSQTRLSNFTDSPIKSLCELSHRNLKQYN